MGLSLFSDPSKEVLAKFSSMSKSLPDVHYEKPEIGIHLTQVGLTDVKKWVRLAVGEYTTLLPVTLEAYIDLSPDMRGFNISRHNEAINQVVNDVARKEGQFEVTALPQMIARELLHRHEYSQTSEVKMTLPYPYASETPLGYPSQEKCMVETSSTAHREGNDILIDRNRVCVEILGSVACPLAKEMVRSSYAAEHRGTQVEASMPFGTHIERVTCRIELTLFRDFKVNVMELVHILENSIRTPLREALKRPDELHVIRKLLDCPQFVEDCVRRCAVETTKNLPGLPDDTLVRLVQRSTYSFSPYDIVAALEGSMRNLNDSVNVEQVPV